MTYTSLKTFGLTWIRTTIELKTIFACENYLLSVFNTTKRSSHKIPGIRPPSQENNRYENMPLCDKTCPFFQSDQNEFHLLIKCPMYTELSGG